MVTKRKMELLAPGGDVDAIKAAILAGANAVYCGLDQFNARNRAVNISFDDLQGILHLAHAHHCEVFLTLNIIVLDREIPALISLLNRLVNTTIDAVIVQDIGLFYLLKTYFPRLVVHASTQMTTHNEGQIHFLNILGASRVNLSRELNLSEIKNLTSVAHRNQIGSEVFVHGSNCISFSGICYMSSLLTGNSGNRGRCSQPCRDAYQTKSSENSYPFNLKDNSAFFDLKELYQAGVDSLKIEGRIKKYDYVYTVVDAWRKQMDLFYLQDKVGRDNSLLYKVFNRDFSNGFLTERSGINCFIDHPRDHSISHLSEINFYANEEEREKGRLKFYQEKDELKAFVEGKVQKLSAEKPALKIELSGEAGLPLQVLVKTAEKQFVIYSDCFLLAHGNQPLDYDMVMKRFKAFNETEYFIEELNLEKVKGEVYISFKELTSLKKKILYHVNGKKDWLEEIHIPKLKNTAKEMEKARLSVLISSVKDLHLCDEAAADIYFQLPACFHDQFAELVELFTTNKKLIPYFPSVIIGDDFTDAIAFLVQVKPSLLLTDNTGIAYEAFRLEMNWIAGPHLNIVNSYSLVALQENLNCSGAFVSNELNLQQIKSIKKPAHFSLHYSIYHPIVLMTSRHCLFQNLSLCDKTSMDESCLLSCKKSTRVSNLKKEAFWVEKTKGNYHAIYNESHFLNLEILKDLPSAFSSVSIDLRDVKTETKVLLEKSEVISLFENLLQRKEDAERKIKEVIYPFTNRQYKKGI
jgi:putative protease